MVYDLSVEYGFNLHSIITELDEKHGIIVTNVHEAEIFLENVHYGIIENIVGVIRQYIPEDEEIDLNDIIELYRLDKELRSEMSIVIEEAETSIRTLLLVEMQKKISHNWLNTASLFTNARIRDIQEVIDEARIKAQKLKGSRFIP